MKISKDQVRKIQEVCLQDGHDVRFRDVAYCTLKNIFDDPVLAYKAIFETDASDIIIGNYNKSAKVKAIEKYIAEHRLLGGKATLLEGVPTETDITFAENKAELIKMLDDVDEKLEMGIIEYKDAAKLKVDIRTKLNDKFAVSEDSAAQIIFVQPKFNTDCPHTQKECWLQTKEYAMEHW